MLGFFGLYGSSASRYLRRTGRARPSWFGRLPHEIAELNAR
ncbi:hypothetical protein LX81_02913 [Palleronia aestuarii]|uniref:Uncharacterized protein n=1 Tax=Palleronia aestuarii TaxID=568105 RepID=A0A2W7N2P3_9RHOB|nr:hypothetical protein [Palleronia aestuarii]PZX14330.1 hypothetical protein LX81_02913 [Palleronia aestuarii]